MPQALIVPSSRCAGTAATACKRRRFMDAISSTSRSVRRAELLTRREAPQGRGTGRSCRGRRTFRRLAPTLTSQRRIALRACASQGGLRRSGGSCDGDLARSMLERKKHLRVRAEYPPTDRCAHFRLQRFAVTLDKLHDLVHRFLRRRKGALVPFSASGFWGRLSREKRSSLPPSRIGTPLTSWRHRRSGREAGDHVCRQSRAGPGYAPLPLASESASRMPPRCLRRRIC